VRGGHITLPRLTNLCGGLGTWSGNSPEEHEKAKPWILTALRSGYTHFDTAHNYGTETVLGSAISEAGIPRDDLFLVTKLPSHHHNRVAASLTESLERLGTNYVDLYLMHWPQSFADRDDDPAPLTPDGEYDVVDHPDISETWKQMEQLFLDKKAKAIGVSNFSIKTLQQLLENAKICPAVNQVEIHPYLTEEPLLAFCAERNIHLTAYSPTGYSNVRTDPAVVSIAKKHEASPAQVVLAWHLARGISACPQSSNQEHQVENIKLPHLSKEEVIMLSALNRNQRLCRHPDPKGSGKVYGWTYDQLGWIKE